MLVFHTKQSNKRCYDSNSVTGPPFRVSKTSQVAQWSRIRLPKETRETGISSLDQKDPLEEEMAPHSSILARRTPWTEEPDGLQSWVAKSQT